MAESFLANVFWALLEKYLESKVGFFIAFLVIVMAKAIFINLWRYIMNTTKTVIKIIPGALL